MGFFLFLFFLVSEAQGRDNIFKISWRLFLSRVWGEGAILRSGSEWPQPLLGVAWR